MFLAGLLLITLFASASQAKAQNETYTVAMANDEATCHITVSSEPIAIATKTFTLTASNGYKLPESLTQVKVGEQVLTAGEGTDANKYTYVQATGVVTISSGTTIADKAVVTVTATGVELGHDATLSALTYSNTNISAGTAQNVPNFDQTPIPDITLAYNKSLEKSAITMTGTLTDENAEITANTGATITNGEATATVTVTAEDGTTKDYVVKFKVANDKLNAITVPSAFTLESRLSEAEVLTLLNETADYNSFAITTVGEQDGLSLDVTWKLKDEATFNAAPKATNDFTWTIADETLVAAKLDKNSKTTTGDVTITNADASTTTVLSSLTYKIGADGQPIDITSDLVSSDECNIELPYGTAVGTEITVNVACKDNATAKVEGETATDKFTLTLNAGGETSLTLVITPESETPTRTVTINFTTEKELVTAVSGVPESYIFTQAVADEAAAIALLEAMDMSGITLTANSRVALKLKWEYSGGGFNNASGQSNNFTWTVVKEDGSEITAAADVTATKTIAVTNYTVSTEAGISALTYQVAGGTKETISTVKEAPTTNDVTVAFGTKSITVSITPADTKATVSLTDQPTEHGTLVDGVTSYETPVVEAFKFTITAEDGQTTKNFIIKFTAEKEKITAVTVPATYKLPAAATDAAAAIAMLADMEGVVIKTNGVTPTKLSWTYEASENGGQQYLNKDGKTNVFSWSAVRSDAGDALEAATGVAITGTTTVTNFMPAVTGNKPDETVKITADNPVDKIGDGEAPTTVNIVEIAVDLTSEQLTIDNATIVNKLDLKESVGEIVLNEVIIPEVVLAENKATNLILQSGNKIDKITNAGTMTLSNATTMAPRSLAIETRAATVNNGSIGTVENNGTFTDKTATISTVKGNANLTITQPSDISTTGSSATLEVGATTTKGTITYLWEKYDNSNSDWVPANGTDAKLTVKKADGNGKYRCQVTNTNTEDKATTTLYTHSASVTFRTSDPSTPSDPTPTPSTKTYTVTLKKVAGATFSQKESTTVDEGDNFSFTITLDKAYNQSKPVVKVGTTTYEPDAKGVYTIKNITKDITIEVSGIVKNTSTGVEETAQDAARVWSEGSTLYIHTPKAEQVYVVSGAGALMRELKAVPGDQNIQLPAGFYIVRVGTYTAKVIIR